MSTPENDQPEDTVGLPVGEVISIPYAAMGLMLTTVIELTRNLPKEPVQGIIRLARDTLHARLKSLEGSFPAILAEIDNFVAVFDSRGENAGLF